MSPLEMTNARKLETKAMAADFSHRITSPVNWHELQRAIQDIAEILRCDNRAVRGNQPGPFRNRGGSVYAKKKIVCVAKATALTRISTKNRFPIAAAPAAPQTLR